MRDVSDIFLGNVDELCEGRRVVDGKFSHHFAVDGDTRLGEPADKFAVGNAVDTRRRIDTGDPQLAEFALFDATVAMGVLPGFHDGFVGFFELFTPRAAITLGELENFFMASVSSDAGFYSGQDNLLRSIELSVGKHSLHACAVCRRSKRRLAEISLAFAGLLFQDVALVSFVAFEFAAARHMETFSCCAVRLDFGHLCPLLLSMWFS